MNGPSGLVIKALTWYPKDVDLSPTCFHLFSVKTGIEKMHSYYNVFLFVKIYIFLPACIHHSSKGLIKISVLCIIPYN